MKDQITRVQLHIKNRTRSQGWIEKYSIGIRPDLAREWANFQINRWNRDHPNEPRELLAVRVCMRKGRALVPASQAVR